MQFICVCATLSEPPHKAAKRRSFVINRYEEAVMFDCQRITDRIACLVQIKASRANQAMATSDRPRPEQGESCRLAVN